MFSERTSARARQEQLAGAARLRVLLVLACVLVVVVTVLGLRRDSPLDGPETIDERSGPPTRVHSTTALAQAAEVDPVRSTAVVLADTPAPAELRLRTGSIEVHVSYSGAPAGAATVDLVPLDELSNFLLGDELLPKPTHARADAHGVALFAGLEPRRYGLTARVGDRSARAFATLSPDRDVVRVDFSFGAGGIEGNVFDLDGRSVSGADVLARQDEAEARAPIWHRARTDAAGAYRIDGFAGGPAHRVRALLAESAYGETLPFELGLEELRRVDFGTPAGRARWSGVVRTRSGQVLQGPLRLCFVAEVGSTSRIAIADGAGAFDVVLSAGATLAHLDGPLGLLLGRAEVAGSIVQDLVVPASTLCGRIEYVGTKHPIARGPCREAVLMLEREDGIAVAPHLVRGEETFAFLGLEPGAYLLSTKPWVVRGAVDGRVRIAIGATEERVETTLEITDP